MPLPGAKRVCGARTRAGGPCQNVPVAGSARCRMHGGKAARGTDHGRFKHGRYSKSVPDRLAGRFREALADEDRHELRDEIALAEARISDLLAGMARVEAAKPEARAWSGVERWVARKTRLVEADARLARGRRQMV